MTITSKGYNNNVLACLDWNRKSLVSPPPFRPIAFLSPFKVFWDFVTISLYVCKKRMTRTGDMIDQIIATSAKDLCLQILVMYSFSETDVLSESRKYIIYLKSI